jgi:hypothetical protein
MAGLYTCSSLMRETSSAQAQLHKNNFSNDSPFIRPFIWQVALVQVPGLNTAFGCTALNWDQWLVCIALGATELPLNFLVSFIPFEWIPVVSVRDCVCEFIALNQAYAAVLRTKSNLFAARCHCGFRSNFYE